MASIGKYSGESLVTYEKIIDGRRTYNPNKVYKNEKHNIYYFINAHGYMHILKPYAIKMDGKVLYYSIEDYLLTKDNMLQSKGWNGEFITLQEVIEELEHRIEEEKPC